MINPPSGLVTNMQSATRNPFAIVKIAWRNVIASGEWFRIDQNQLDAGALLTAQTYQLGEEIQELINEIDSFVYDNESAYIKMIEGYSEFVGDSNQYSISDFDCELVNFDDRFTPKENKNVLENGGFENSFDFWNRTGGAPESYINTNIVKTGVRSLCFPNSSAQTIFSSLIPVNYGLPLSSGVQYSYSGYAIGSGVINIGLNTYSAVAKGFDNLTSGLLNTYSTTITADTDWVRNGSIITVASGVSYLRTVLSRNSGNITYVDDIQVELGGEITGIDEYFIGDALVPKRPIKVDVGFGFDSVPKFAGLINKLQPNMKDDTIHIYSYDWADKLKDTQITGDLYEAKRTDQLIEILADKSGISAERRKLEIGTKTLDFAYFPEGSAWFYMTQIAEAEGGRVFFDENGTLTFWNKSHSILNEDPKYSFTMDSDILDLEYEISKDKIKNKITVVANTRDIIDRTIIYNDKTAPSINPGETKEFWCQYSYNDDASIPAKNVEVPTIGTEIIGNAMSDGSGANKNSSLSVSSSSVFAESIRVNIHNSSAAIVYLTKFVVYGRPIVVVKNISVTREDSESQYRYDIQELTIENDYIDNYDFAEDLAERKLAELKSPRNFINIQVVGVPYLQLGDIVTVEDSYDGSTNNYRIVKNRWTLDGDFIQNLSLEKHIIL